MNQIDYEEKRMSETLLNYHEDVILNEVSNAICAMDVVAQSYGVAFSKTLIKQLYDELEKHIDSI